MKILITGSKGQLGTEFVDNLTYSNNIYAFDKEELDITNLDKVYEVLKTLKPDIIINCASYNLVDKAEQEFEKALYVNAFGVRNLCILAKETKSFLIHYSTDYVFDGQKRDFYKEEDIPNPLNKYALSKLLGEKEICSILEDRFLIFRTSWVYGKGKQNFLYKLTLWSQNNDYLKIACDEFSVPTSTKTIVNITLKALEKGLVGLYHLVNSDYASRYEWAKEYFRLKDIKTTIYPAYQSEFNLCAKRPNWSVLDNKTISKALNIHIKHWKEALKESLVIL